MTRRGLLAVAGALGAATLACSSSGTGADASRGVVDTLGAAWPTPLVVDGTRLLYGERLDGEIVSVPFSETGFGEPVPLADVETRAATDDQRGLLGLAVVDEVVYASWTRAGDGRLVVGAVDPEERPVWEGPPSADRANGGHLLAAPDGSLVIGVGNLLDGGRVDDPTAPNGKLLRLDPLADPDQEAEVITSGWNNPFAFAYDPDGRLWVADNAGPRSSERIGRGDVPGTELVELADPEDQRAPSAMIPLGDEALGLCGFVSREMEVVGLVGDRAEPTGSLVTAEACTLGAVALADGRIVVATETTLSLVEPDLGE